MIEQTDVPSHSPMLTCTTLDIFDAHQPFGLELDGCDWAFCQAGRAVRIMGCRCLHAELVLAAVVRRRLSNNGHCLLQFGGLSFCRSSISLLFHMFTY